MLNSKSIKVTLVLNPAEVKALPKTTAERIVLQILADGQPLTADIKAQSLRKCQAAIREHGADGVAVILQGKLLAGGVIGEAGLSAQPRAPAAKPAAAAAA